jgi:very-short-patch-repair endonuclease
VSNKSVLLGSFRNAPPDAAVAATASSQHGLVTVAQLRAAGLRGSAIAKRVRAGRLHRVGRGVYAVGHTSLSQEARWMAAVLEAGEGAVLSHLAAAKLWEIWRRRVTRIDVVSPRQSRLPYVHWTRHLATQDIRNRNGIPVTTVARTLVDLTDLLTSEQLANVIHEAAFRNRFSAEATHAAMGRAQGRRNLQALEAALQAHASVSAGTKSALEDRFLDQVRKNGLPEPLVNTRVHGIEVDFLWPESQLVVEVDGPGHARPRTRRDDAERDARLEAAGFRVVRVRGPARIRRGRPSR